MSGAESWKALAAAVCVAELDAAAEGHAPPAAAEGCPNRAMSALAARLRASIDFRPRLLHLMASAQLPEGTLGASPLPRHPHALLCSPHVRCSMSVPVTGSLISEIYRSRHWKEAPP